MPEQHIVVNGEIREILQRLTRIEQRMDDLAIPDATRCAVHGHQISEIRGDVKELKSQVTMDRKITVGVSAVTASILVALKWAFLKG